MASAGVRIAASAAFLLWTGGALAQSPYAGAIGGGGGGGTAGPPTVTALTPNTGPTTGGTAVIVNGTNFAGATAVNFGANSATFAIVTSSTINVTSPAGALGTINVRVTTPLGTSAIVAADQYTYITASGCSGVLDLSTGCAQMVAYGGLF